MKNLKKITVTLALTALTGAVNAQYITPFTYNIAGSESYGAIVNETSGERTLNYIIDMAAYELVNRDFKNMKESEYVLSRGREFGLKDIKVNRYECEMPTWVAKKGELWITYPELTKIADIHDMPAVLVEESASADCTAEVIWIDNYSKEALDAMDLTGKIVMGDQAAASIAHSIKGRGAVGIVSTYSRFQYEDPQQVPNYSLRVGENSEKLFAFNISPLVGRDIRARLRSGGKMEMMAKVETFEQSFELQSPSCVIEGSDPSEGEIILSAHLFEGYVKLGANDNSSGSAAILEVARTINKLIDEGKIERPKRSIRFIWGDEFTGIIPWIHANPEIIDRALCNINLDMVGVGLMKESSLFNAYRTKFSTAHYLNDVIENLFKYMGDTNTDNSSIGAFTEPVFAPSGTRDPFVYIVQTFSGYSDHEIFQDPSFMIPSTLFITWPDKQYHSSADRPDILDPTQLKRAAVLAASTAYTIAAADEKKAFEIATLVASGAKKRLGDAQSRLSYIVNNYDGKQIDSLYKELSLEAMAVTLAEKRTIESVEELAKESSALKSYIASQVAELSNLESGVKSSTEALISAKFGKKPTFKLSKEELKAMDVMPIYIAKERGYDAGGFRFGFIVSGHEALTTAEQVKELSTITDRDNLTEILALAANGIYSKLEMLYLVNAQREIDNTMSLEDMDKVLDVMEEAKLIKIETKK